MAMLNNQRVNVCDGSKGFCVSPVLVSDWSCGSSGFNNPNWRYISTIKHHKTVAVIAAC